MVVQQLLNSGLNVEHNMYQIKPVYYLGVIEIPYV